MSHREELQRPLSPRVGSGSLRSQRPPGSQRVRGHGGELPCTVRSDALLVGTLVVFVVTLIVIYVLAITAGRVTRTDFYISTALNEDYGRRIGDLGLSLWLIMLSLVFLSRYTYMWSQIHGSVYEPKSKLHLYNKIAFGFGLLGVVGGAGVLAFPSFTDTAHLVFAFTAFVAILIYLTYHVVMERAITIDRKEPRLHPARIVLLALAILCLIGMAATTALFTSEFYPSLFELLMVLFAGVYIMSWIYQMRRYEMIVVSTRDSMVNAYIADIVDKQDVEDQV